MQTPARHFPATAWTACLITAVVLCSSANHARAQDDLITADPADLLAISQLTIGMDPVEACGDRAIQCSSAGGIPHADGGWEKSCKDSRKIISLASRGKMKPIHKGVCKAKYLVVDADQEGQPTLRYADYAMYDGKECKRWPDAGARTTMTEEEVAIAALEGRLVGASKLRGALFKWYKAQSNPPPFSALPLTAKRKIDPAQWNFGVISPTCGCQCGAWEMVDAVVNNARRGDVAIVSITDGSGDRVVNGVMRTLKQNHRHALMFTSNNSVRHATSMLDPGATESGAYYIGEVLVPITWEKGDPQRCEWDPHPTWGERWKNTYLPGGSRGVVGKQVPYFIEMSGVYVRRIKAEFLRNGLPGVISQSISEAMDCQRLGYTGLVLTHGADASGEARAAFRAAADYAESQSGYYKVSEYSGLGGWNLSSGDSPVPPLQPNGYEPAQNDDHDYTENFLTQDLKGTHCSGFVQASLNAAFEDAGRDARVQDFLYSAAIRKNVAEELFAATKATAEQGGVKKKNGSDNLAHQAVNCFSGVDRDCSDNTKTWKKVNLGAGASVSPDNLLPKSFTLKNPEGTSSGTTYCTAWDNYLLETDTGWPKPLPQKLPWKRDLLCAGDLVDDASIGHTSGQDTASHPSPFKRVEPFVLGGDQWTYADVPMLGDWAQTLPGAP